MLINNLFLEFVKNLNTQEHYTQSKHIYSFILVNNYAIINRGNK